MKNTKLLLGSLAIACALSACSHKDEAVVANPEATISGRPQVNLVLGSPAQTRLQVEADGASVGFTTNDQLGAVLVDSGIGDGWNGVNWTAQNGHSGNNKWYWNGDNFTTEGTTAVGAWLFYSMYDEAMTSKRSGVEFSFPQIQDGAADLSKVANNNINFHISPIVRIDGVEGDDLNIPVKYASVYNYLNIKLAFEEAGVTSVEKILVYATDANGDDVAFPAKSKVNNRALENAGAVAKMSLVASVGTGNNKIVNNSTFVDNNDNSTVSSSNNTATYDANDLVLESEIAYAAISDVAPEKDTNGKNKIQNGAIKNWVANWNAANTTVGTLTDGIGEETYDYLVVDCGEHASGLAVVDGKFSTWMLMPAGVYNTITLKIYTNKGVYTKDVEGYNHYKENIVTSGTRTQLTQADKSAVILRPQAVNSITNIKKLDDKGDDAIKAENDYLFIPKAGVQAVGNVVTNNAELINLINAISTKNSNNDIRVVSQNEVNGATDAAIPAHGIVINQAVVDAINAKETALGGKIYLTFTDAKVSIQGNATADERLNVHDMTFSKGCDVIGGYVSTSHKFVVPTGQKMTVKTGADVLFGTNATVSGNTTTWNDTIAEVLIENGANAAVAGSIKNKPIKIENKGTLTVNAQVALTNAQITNHATFVVNGEVNATKFVAQIASATTNNGVLTVGAGTEIKGNVTNNAEINVIGNTTIMKGTENNVAYEGSVVNNTDAKLLANSTTANTVLTNNGSIVNYGKIYTQNASNAQLNKIHNWGTIEVKAGSTTYITTNSKYDETTHETNSGDQIMGVLKVDVRNERAVAISTAKQQGYIQYAVAATDLVNGVFSANEDDIFNKIILSDAAELDANLIASVLYVETSNNLTLPEYVTTTTGFGGTTTTKYPFPVKELTFTDDAIFVAPNVIINELNVNEGVLLDIQRGSNVNVKAMTASTYGRDTWKYTNYENGANLVNAITNVAIHNYGEILLGGKFETSLTQAAAKEMSTKTKSNGAVVEGKFSSTSSEPGAAYTWNKN